jgi:hypothetical protein
MASAYAYTGGAFKDSDIIPSNASSYAGYYNPDLTVYANSENADRNAAFNIAYRALGYM